MSQGRYWIVTIPFDDWRVPEELPSGVVWLKGQQEIGHEGYNHWQLIAAFGKKVRMGAAKKVFGVTAHVELTISKAANEYVWKDETSVPDTRFEMGAKLLKRQCSKDWDVIWSAAKRSRFEDIPADVKIRSYMALKRIAADYMQPEAVEREVWVFWGRTGTGKSRRAWSEAGLDAYPKDPRTKFWDGYQGQLHVVMDEFDGAVDICHLLRWFDRYPVCVEVKGSSVVLKAVRIWITSNVDPRLWFPLAKKEQIEALMRRLKVFEFPFVMRPVDDVYSTPRFLMPSTQELEALMLDSPCPPGVRY